MRTSTLSCVRAAVAFGLVLSVNVPSAHAIKAFKDQFEAKYIKTDSEQPNDKALAEAFATAKCNVCHEGRSKKNRNVYGAALSELLDKKEDKENAEKIQAALDEVAAKKADPNNADSPTFGERLANGKLPVGDPE